MHAIAYNLPGRHLVFLVKHSEEQDLRDWRLELIMEDGKPLDCEQRLQQYRPPIDVFAAYPNLQTAQKRGRRSSDSGSKAGVLTDVAKEDLTLWLCHNSIHPFDEATAASAWKQ